jgi:hypothetical protein
MSKSYYVDNFVTTKPGNAYRLLPFGKITRGGKTRDITPEYAAQFKLPPFKVPIKLGSHDDVTPAGGHIVGLEVREDGLYGIPEYTEKGEKAVNDGDFRYHSPEIIFDEGALETNEGVIPGPLLVGDSLLHTPYLGESTAFYTSKEIDMQENISVPKGLFEKLMELIKPAADPEPPAAPEPAPVVVTEAAEFKAVASERDDYKTQLETLKAEAATKEARVALSAQLQKKEDYGVVFAEATAADEAAGVLAGLSESDREFVLRNFRALIAQIDESKLTKETGTENATPVGDDPKAEYNAQVLKLAEEKKINYVEAFNLGKTVHADLFNSAYGKK